MNAAVFLNGEIPRRKIVSKYLKKGAYIIAADGGSNYLIKEGITPDLIIGDLDSAKNSTIKSFRKKGVRILKLDEQETTDFEKSLVFCRQNKLENIIVFGSSSLRMDHTFNNFSILKRYCKIMNIILVDDIFEKFIITGGTEFSYKVNEIISFIAVPKAYNVRTKGVLYKLKGEDLEFGIREGSLNISSSDRININFDKGYLLIFKKHFL